MTNIVIFALVVVLPSLITCAAVKNILYDEEFIHPNKDDQWMDYKIRFRKEYSNEAEERGRHFSWRRQLKFIEKHNSNPANRFQLGVNHFADMEHSEFLEKMGGCLKVPQELMIDNRTLRRHPLSSEFLPPANLGTLPDTIDWRELGAVTPVKNQGQCGSCWAFSSTGALEGQWFRQTKKLPNLSEQNLVDCATKNFACRGGWPDFAFEYVKKNDGIDDELGYPYYAKPLGYCYYRKTYRSASDVGFEDVSTGDEKMLKIAVATRGPVSVAIDARHPKFMAYKTGVYVDKECGNTLTSLDHAVLVVGYGTEDGQDYWLVKNSWGELWGERGYIKMARNKDNQCGIALKASIPLV